ncbi:MAG: hypothetical protein KJ709_05535 [Nanoarchaeota archaeon]|nr:hypothetical protein [Nanoarchaeota archaeon]
MRIPFRRKKEDAYERVLNKAYSVENLKREITALTTLLKRKEQLDKTLRERGLDDSTCHAIEETLDEIINRLHQYQRYFSAAERISNKLVHQPKHSSHLLVKEKERLEKEFGATFDQVVEYYEKKKIAIQSRDISSYFKTSDFLSPDSMKTAFKHILSKGFFSSKFVLIGGTLVLIAIASPAYKSCEFLFRQVWEMNADNQTPVEQAFHGDTGVRFYSDSDEEVNTLHFLLNNIYNNPGLLHDVGVKRIIIIRENLIIKASYCGLFDEINLPKIGHDKSRFVSTCFHELGHAIDENNPRKNAFRRKVIGIFKKRNNINQFKAKMRSDGYDLFARYFEWKREIIANFYEARMMDFYYYYEEHGRLPTLSEILNEKEYQKFSIEQRQDFSDLMVLYAHYGFFPEHFSLK